MKYGIKKLPIVSPQGERENASALQKLFYHFKMAKAWKNAISQIYSNDNLILQFLIVNHTLFFYHVVKYTKKGGVKIYAIIHDLETIRRSNEAEISMRTKWRIKREEADELKLFEGIIVHNAKMKKYKHEKFGIPNEKLVELGIFDYLIDDKYQPADKVKDYKSCIIAGNLNRKKSSYWGLLLIQ